MITEFMKDKRKKLFIAIIFLVLVVVGYITYSRLNFKIENKENNQASLFTSIKDALSDKTLSFACEFNNPEGGVVETYVKNGIVRISVNQESGLDQNEMLLTNNKIYLWNEETKDGIVYEVDENLIDESSNADSIRDNYFRMIDEYKDNCKSTSIEDSLFEVPSDVSFRDMSELFEKFGQMNPQ